MTIFGSSDRHGNIVINIDAQSQKLEAPPLDGERRHYLPCCLCGRVEAVEWNVVSFTCETTAEDPHVDVIVTPKWARSNGTGERNERVKRTVRLSDLDRIEFLSDEVYVGWQERGDVS